MRRGLRSAAAFTILMVATYACLETDNLIQYRRALRLISILNGMQPGSTTHDGASRSLKGYGVWLPWQCYHPRECGQSVLVKNRPDWWWHPERRLADKLLSHIGLQPWYVVGGVGDDAFVVRGTGFYVVAAKRDGSLIEIGAGRQDTLNLNYCLRPALKVHPDYDFTMANVDGGFGNPYALNLEMLNAAAADEHKMRTTVNLDCLVRFGACSGYQDLMPLAWAAYEDDHDWESKHQAEINLMQRTDPRCR